MRCLACHYELWNLTGNLCPECGATFSASDYRFTPGDVSFACRGCGEARLGDLPDGLPPARWTCRDCGDEVRRSDCTVSLADPGGADPTIHGLPLTDGEGGLVARYFKTVWLILVQPRRAISGVAVESPLLRAWVFVLCTILASMFASMVPSMIIFLLVSIVGAGGTGGGKFLMIGTVMGLQIAAAVGVLAVLAVCWALASHGLLVLSGGTAHGLRRTMQVMLYSGGTLVVMAVPCCGGATSMIWWVVAAVLMTTRAQHVSGLRATLCIAGVPAVIGATCVGIYIAAIALAVAGPLSNF